VPLEWDGKENQKGKIQKLIGIDKDSLIDRAKAVYASKAK